MSLICRLAMVCALALSCAEAAVSAAFDHEHAAWSALLQETTAWSDDGGTSWVDYAAVAARRERLDAYLAELASVPSDAFERWSLEQRQAFLINAYNAHTLALVLTGYPRIASIRELGSWWRSPWKRRIADLLGSRRSLDDIEHGLLRGAPDFAEPRIHFAVNCASIGCPALRPEAFVADRLDSQLEDQTLRFLRDRSRNRLQGAGPVEAQLSAIFQWYQDDFGGHAGLGRFLAQRAAALGADEAQAQALAEARYTLRPMDYDWRLNHRDLPAPEPR